MADPVLRRPVQETFDWLQGRLTGLLAQGRASGELLPALDPAATAATRSSPYCRAATCWPAGRHFHPGPVAGYVESGLITFERDGQPVRELRPGDVFFEPAGEVIHRFDNSSAASRPPSSPFTWSTATSRSSR